MVHDPVFRLGVLPIHPFGLSVAAGIIVAYLVTLWRAARARLPLRRLPSFLLILSLGSLIIARAGFALAHPVVAHGVEGFLSLWDGGLSLPAGVIGGALLLLAIAWARGESFWAWADAAAPGTALGLAIGVLGLPASGEGWGAPTTGPFFMHVDPALRPLAFVNDTQFTPIFAYEAVVFASIAAFVTLLSWRPRSAEAPGARNGELGGTAGVAFVVLILFCYALLQPLTLDASTTPSLVLKIQALCALGSAVPIGLLVARKREEPRRARFAGEVTRVQDAHGRS